MRSNFGKTFGIQEPQTDSHVTTHCTINVESISHETPTNTKDEIDIEPPTKIKRKSNLNHQTDRIPHKIENESQLIDEDVLEEPESTENEPQTLHHNGSLVDKDFKDFLTGTK